MTPIQLPALSVAIPLIWKAFNAQKLQAQHQQPGDPCYSGPCAIGALMEFEERLALDAYSSYMGINLASHYGLVNLANPDELEDYDRLQVAHDQWLRHQTDINYLNVFVLLLTELGEKYK